MFESMKKYRYWVKDTIIEIFLKFNFLKFLFKIKKLSTVFYHKDNVFDSDMWKINNWNHRKTTEAKFYKRYCYPIL